MCLCLCIYMYVFMYIDYVYRMLQNFSKFEKIMIIMKIYIDYVIIFFYHKIVLFYSLLLLY